MSFGAKDSHARARDKKQVKEYDVIMDEEIEFVQALQMPGTIDKKVGYTQPSHILWWSALSSVMLPVKSHVAIKYII